jgi:predicted metalloprotease
MPRRSIGDDALQRAQPAAHAVPDSFTHGSSAQRQRWFDQGLQGWQRCKGCDTFSAHRQSVSHIGLQSAWNMRFPLYKK